MYATCSSRFGYVLALAAVNLLLNSSGCSQADAPVDQSQPAVSNVEPARPSTPDDGAQVDATTATPKDAGGNAADAGKLAELLLAAEQGSAPRVEELLKEGVGVNDSNAEGETALMRAAANGHGGLTETLLTVHKADPTLKNKAGKTAEELAREKGHTATAEVFEKVAK